MGLPVIGLFVRLVGNGIGLAQEAIAAKKERSRSSAADFAPESSTPKNKGLEMASDAPPPYEENVIQVSPDHAEELIAKGHAVLAETKHDPELSKGHPGEASILKSRSRSVASSTKSGDDDSDDSSSDSEDEAEWALDDAAGDVEDAKSQSDQKKYGFNAQPTIESLVDMVLQKCPSPPSVARRLSLPVILPQRRPGNKDRGFIRAYAPVLTDHGVPEDAFLTFVKNLHTAAKASPILNVVFISAGIVGFFPELAAQITSTVVQIAVGTAIELQKRQRGNSFLDQMNERFFRPRGLFALLMTYKHEGKKPIHSEPVDIMKVISKRTAAEQNLLAPIRLGEGTSYGELEMPESAPLVFPSLDEAAEQTVDAQKMDMLKSSQRFLADYFDRRAQAVYAADNPNSSLQLPSEKAPKFASRFSDPNDPIHNGSLIALITGGKLNPGARKAERREARRERRTMRREVRHIRRYGVPGHPEVPIPPIRQRRPRGKKAKRAMKTNVLYLMIVNMPTPEELSAAESMVRHAHSGSP